jgi:hypothetical protein
MMQTVGQNHKKMHNFFCGSRIKMLKKNFILLNIRQRKEVVGEARAASFGLPLEPEPGPHQDDVEP